MGGDFAPKAVIDGALEAAPAIHSTIFLVGDSSQIERLLPASRPPNIEVIHASQSVGMDEKPLDSYRRKKDSSLMVCARLVKEGRARALVSAGNTGAVSATALLTWRQVPGIHRPAIASVLPNPKGGFLLLDTGASPDVDPKHLVDFAVMGRAYAEKVMGRRDPKVHLLNIGEEEGKGSAFAKATYRLLAPHDWFAGNIEGKDMYTKPCDVVVCEAFVGNVVLKSSEGLAELIVSSIREGVPRYAPAKWLYWPVKKVMAPLRKQMDYAETGGSPLLGLNGLCIISHGRSNAKAIKNALLLAQRGIESCVVDTIREAILGEGAETGL